MDDETVVSGAAADDQTEHEQCKFLYFVHQTILLWMRRISEANLKTPLFTFL